MFDTIGKFSLLCSESYVSNVFNTTLTWATTTDLNFCNKQLCKKNNMNFSHLCKSITKPSQLVLTGVIKSLIIRTDVKMFLYHFYDATHLLIKSRHFLVRLGDNIPLQSKKCFFACVHQAQSTLLN